MMMMAILNSTILKKKIKYNKIQISLILKHNKIRIIKSYRINRAINKTIFQINQLFKALNNVSKVKILQKE